MADGERESYDLNVGRLIMDYQDFTVMGDPSGFGYRAQLRTEDGSGHTGPEVGDPNLDGLAAKMDDIRAAASSPSPRP